MSDRKRGEELEEKKRERIYQEEGEKDMGKRRREKKRVVKKDWEKDNEKRRIEKERKIERKRRRRKRETENAKRKMEDGEGGTEGYFVLNLYIRANDIQKCGLSVR